MVFHSACIRCDKIAVIDDLRAWLEHPICCDEKPDKNTCKICNTVFVDDQYAESYLATHHGFCLDCTKTLRKLRAIIEFTKAATHPETWNGRKYLDPWKPIPEDPFRAVVADLDPHDYLDYYAEHGDPMELYTDDIWDDWDTPQPKVRKFNTKPESYTLIIP